MKAAVWTPENNLEVVARPDPEPQPGWVRVRVTSAGICGSDLHTYRAPAGNQGGIPGHEIAGLVDACGEGVALKTGSAVAVEPVGSCGGCGYCTAENPWHCAEKTFFGGDSDGGMAEYIVVPASCAHLLPDNVDPRDGALAEPLAVGVRGVNQGGVRNGDRVVIIGAGSVGLTGILAARAAGASEVFITARHKSQGAMAQKLGADGVFPTIETAMRTLGDSRVDCVLETVGGHGDTLREACMVAGVGATVVLLGIFPEEPALPALAVTLKELDIVGSICYGNRNGRREFAAAVDLLGEEYENVKDLVTHRFPLDDVGTAFETALDKATGSLKVQLDP